MRPIQQDLVILQGATFSQLLQWCSSDAVHKLISAVAVGLPTLLTVPAHGLTARTPVWITNVKGPRDINTVDYRQAQPRSASVVDVNTLALDFDSGSLTGYQSGGVLTYYPPINLTGYTARMQIRTAAGAPAVLLELNSTTGGIVITAATGTIERRIEAAATAALVFSQGLYDLSLTDASGFTTRLAEGAVSVAPEVTR